MPEKLISGDNHIDLTYLPPDLWSSEAPNKWKLLAPRVEEMDDGLHWFVEAQDKGMWNGIGPGFLPYQKGMFGHIDEMKDLGFEWNSRPGAKPRPTTPELRLADLDRDGLSAEIIYGCLMINDLISEAGLPAVADPGARLVALAHETGIEVVPLSGPSSLLLAVAASGLNGQSFAFVGYLPVEAGGRTARIRELEALSAKAQQTQLLIETPYRNEALRQALLAALKPGTRLSISVGLTLPGGWTRTATVADWKRGAATLPDRIPAVFAILA